MRKVSEVEEIKEKLAEKCKRSWKMYEMYKREFGTGSVPVEKMQTEWYTYDSLYEEFFGEEVEY